MHWQRLIRGEFIPLTGKLVLWGLVALVLGVTALVQLLAATLCINAAYGLCAVSTLRPVRQRIGAAPEVLGTAIRRAWALEGGSMLAGVIALFLIGAFYAGMGGGELVPLLWLMGWGLPARCSGPLKSGMGPFLPRLLRAGVGIVLVGAVLLAEPTVANVALALAAREWVTALLMAWIPRYWPRAPQSEVRTDPPPWTEFLAVTAAVSMRRFFYQTGRSLLHVTLGPVGTILARTGRGMGLMKKTDSFARARLVAVLVTLTGMVAMVLAVRLLPATTGLAISVLMLRATSAGAGAVIWSLLAPRLPDAKVDPEDEEPD